MAFPAILATARKLAPKLRSSVDPSNRFQPGLLRKSGSAIFKAAGGHEIPLLKKSHEALGKRHAKAKEKAAREAEKKSAPESPISEKKSKKHSDDPNTGQPKPSIDPTSQSESSISPASGESHSQDLVKALTGMGFKHNDADSASRQVPKESSLTDAIKQALKILTSTRKDQSEQTQRNHDEAVNRAKESTITPVDNTSVKLLQEVAVNTSDIKSILAKQNESTKGGLLGGLASSITSGVGSLLTTALGGAAAGGVAAKGAGMLGKLGKGALSGIKVAAGALGGAGLFGLGKGALNAGTGMISAGKAAEGAADAGAKGLAGKAAAGAEDAAKVATGAEKAAATISKDAAGGALKTVGKSVLKKIPVIGLLAGIGFGVKRALAGDWVGAGMEVASGAAGMAPGLGTAASVGIDAALIARDLSKDGKELVTPDATTEKKSSIDAAADDTSFVDKFYAGQNSPTAVRSDVANVQSSGSVASTLSTMLARMMDEKSGIYVKQATSALTDPAASERSAAALKAQASVPPQLTAPSATVVNKPFSAVQSTPAQTPADFRPKSSTISPMSSGANASLAGQTQDAITKGVKYGFGSKSLASGKIDCSGWVASINKNLIDDMSKQGEKLKGSAEAKKMFEGGSAEIVGNIAKVTGEVMTNKDLTADKVKEGMIIGENNGAAHGRGKYGIDHVTQVIKDPETGKLMISQSSGGKGVSKMPVEDYLAKKNAKGTKLFGVDTQKALSTLTSGDYDAKAKQLSTAPATMAADMQKARDESRVDDKPATVIVNQQVAGGSKNVNSGSAGGAGLNAPMISRNPDSSIRRLTDATMSASVN